MGGGGGVGSSMVLVQPSTTGWNPDIAYIKYNKNTMQISDYERNLAQNIFQKPG